MKACGPLVHLWCMKFEAKHKESKATATSSNLKINIGTTIAFKHQLKLASALLSGTIFSDIVEVGSGDYSSFKELFLEIKDDLPLDSKVYFVKWIKKYGILYKPGMIITISEDDGITSFGLIKYLIFENGHLSFIYRELETIFINHFYAYETCNYYNLYHIIQHQSLLNHIPSHVTKMYGRQFIVTRCML